MMGVPADILGEFLREVKDYHPTRSAPMIRYWLAYTTVDQSNDAVCWGVVTFANTRIAMLQNYTSGNRHLLTLPSDWQNDVDEQLRHIDVLSLESRRPAYCLDGGVNVNFMWGGGFSELTLRHVHHCGKSSHHFLGALFAMMHNIATQLKDKEVLAFFKAHLQ